MSYQEKKEFAVIEDEIVELENRITELEDQMESVTDYQKITKLTRQRDELLELLENKNDRFLYLLDLQEKINNQ